MKVYLGEVIHPAAVALLEKNAEVVRPKDHSRKAYLEALKDVDGMVARKVHVGAEEMNQAPRMKIIARHGVGLDSVDLEEATRRGVLVTNTPGANRESVAELAITFMLSLARRVPQAQKAMANMPKGDIGIFSSLLKQYNLTGVDLEGKPLGIIGTGRIGSAVARKCIAAFDMKVQGYDPYVSAETMKSFGVQKVERLEDMLPKVDFLTVHCPLTQETKGMVGKKGAGPDEKGSLRDQYGPRGNRERESAPGGSELRSHCRRSPGRLGDRAPRPPRSAPESSPGYGNPPLCRDDGREPLPGRNRGGGRGAPGSARGTPQVPDQPGSAEKEMNGIMR